MNRFRSLQRGPGNLALSRRRLLQLGSAALGAATVSGSTLGQSRISAVAAQDNQVVTTGGGGAWQAALEEAYFRPFTEETGIEVVIVDYPENAELQLKIETDTVDVDLVEFTGSALYAFVEEDLLDQLDPAFFPEELMANIIAEAQFEGYGISSHIGSVIAGYRTDVFAEPPASWADFWNVETFPGARSLGTGDGPGTCTLEIAVLADGVAPADLYPLDLDRAFASLDKIRDSVDTWWTTGTQAPQMLTDQQVDLTSAYNGRIQDIADQGEPVAIMWEQGVIYAPPYVIPNGAPHRENANRLLAYMLDAERQARFSELISYGPVNSQAYEFLSPERGADLPSSPEHLEVQVRQDDQWWATRDESGRPMYDVAAERWLQWVAG